RRDRPAGAGARRALGAPARRAPCPHARARPGNTPSRPCARPAPAPSPGRHFCPWWGRARRSSRAPPWWGGWGLLGTRWRLRWRLGGRRRPWFRSLTGMGDATGGAWQARSAMHSLDRRARSSPLSSMAVKAGFLGYGLAGRLLHAPIATAAGIEIAAIATTRA